MRHAVVRLGVAELERRRTDAFVHVALVLHEQRATAVRVVEQATRRFANAVANHEGVRADDNRVVRAERGVRELLVVEHLDVEPDATQDPRQLVAHAGDVAVAVGLVQGDLDHVDLDGGRVGDVLAPAARALVGRAIETRRGLHHRVDRRLVDAAAAVHAVAQCVAAGWRSGGQGTPTRATSVSPALLR